MKSLTVLGTKEIISKDRATDLQELITDTFKISKGRGTPEEAFNAWFKMIKKRYKLHNQYLEIDDHPKYIKDKLRNLNPDQFGYNAFGLKKPKEML